VANVVRVAAVFVFVGPGSGLVLIFISGGGSGRLLGGRAKLTLELDYVVAVVALDEVGSYLAGLECEGGFLKGRNELSLVDILV